MTAPNEPPVQQEIQPGTPAARLAVKQRLGGIVVPFLTLVLAFLVGVVVVAATQHSLHTGIFAFRDIFNGAGLNWIFHPTTSMVSNAAYNLSETLQQSSTLILTGLAVAFAFRCGMFNIGGQGQYFAGLVVANWVGVDLAGMATFPHILIAVVAAALAGAAWAAIAGVLKATVGAHEVISTIMLNWIAFWITTWLFGDGGPLQNSTQPTSPTSNAVSQSGRLPEFWGAGGLLGGLSYGIFIALGALIVFWAILNRTTLGYEVRAVGYNPDAAAYGGINVKKNFVRAMAISGAFAGLAGAVDMLGGTTGYQFGSLDVPVSQVGFLGIAVALLGRNTALGTLFGALLFGSLLYGTTHGLNSTSAIPPELAGNLTYLIQGLVVLFIGADLLILSVWNSRKKLRRRGPPADPAAPAVEAAA